MSDSKAGGKKKKHVSKYSDAIRTRNKKRKAACAYLIALCGETETASASTALA